MTTPTQVVVNVQTIHWQTSLKAINSDHAFTYIGTMTNMQDTFLVADTQTKANMFYCHKHQYAYGLKDRCAECVTQALDEPNGAGVTARNTP